MNKTVETIKTVATKQNLNTQKTPPSSFAVFGVDDFCLQRLLQNNITTPTQVQRAVIPEIKKNCNVIFQSQTGTGKTLAYLLPLVQKVQNTKDANDKSLKIIIVSPTNELSSQIKTQIQTFCPLSCTLCIGGAAISRQIEALKQKPCVVVGNISRIRELLCLKKLKVTSCHTLVLDEVDRLFAKEIKDVTIDFIKHLPKNIQIIANSATVTQSTIKTLEALIKQTGNTLETKHIFLKDDTVLKKHIKHYAIFCPARQKIELLKKFLASQKPQKALIFTCHLDQVQNIVLKLKYNKIECIGLTSKTPAKEKKTILECFRSGKVSILVTSDLTSRGLDIPNITHIIQMDLQKETETFVHRAGRAARAGLSGTNIVIGDEYEMRLLSSIEKKLGITVEPKVLYGGRLLSPQDVNI